MKGVFIENFCPVSLPLSDIWVVSEYPLPDWVVEIINDEVWCTTAIEQYFKTLNLNERSNSYTSGKLSWKICPSQYTEALNFLKRIFSNQVFCFFLSCNLMYLVFSYFYRRTPGH